jgi:repressor LexA
MDFLRGFLQQHQYPPSIREIQQGCGISSTSVVDYNLHILQREGLIRRSPDISRGIELLEAGGARARQAAPTTVPVQVIGAIAAGEPLPVFTEGFDAEPLETLELPAAMASGAGPTYALRVKGLSMIDALIDDGDIVVLERVAEARNGDMVAVWLIDEREATLKRIYHEGERVRLEPANSQMAPIYVDAKNVEVHGRVVGVIRLLH